MDLVKAVGYRAGLHSVEVQVVSGVSESASGVTTNPTIVALACCAFTYRFPVQMLTNKDGRITTFNVLPDVAAEAMDPAPAPASLEVTRMQLEPGLYPKWPMLNVEFADERKATDDSGIGFVEPIVRAGLTSGEGLRDVELTGPTISHIRVRHEP